MRFLTQFTLVSGLTLWIMLGSVVVAFYKIGNMVIVNMWAATSGVLFLMMIGLELLHSERRSMRK